MQSFEFSFSCLLPPQSLFPPSVEVTNHGLLKHQQPQPDIKSATNGILDKCYETPGSRDFPFCYSTVVNYWTVYKTRVTSPFSIIWTPFSSLLEKKRSINDILFHTYYDTFDTTVSSPSSPSFWEPSILSPFVQRKKPEA